MVRIWAESTATAGGATTYTSLLPDCAAKLLKGNVDVLGGGFRDSDTPGVAYTGEKNGAGDPAVWPGHPPPPTRGATVVLRSRGYGHRQVKPDAWAWRTLAVALGEVTSARVCAGLQTGAVRRMGVKPVFFLRPEALAQTQPCSGRRGALLRQDGAGCGGGGRCRGLQPDGGRRFRLQRPRQLHCS